MKKLILIAAMFAGVYANASSSMNIKAVFQGPLCHGDATGSISLVMDGGSAPYSYLWSDGSTTSSISNLLAGIYSVTVQDNSGLTASTSVSFSEPDALALSAMAISVSPSGANNGGVLLTVRGGTPDFSYSWDNGALTKDLSGLAPGNYAVTVTDGLGCQASTTASVQDAFIPMVIGNNHHESRSVAAGVGEVNTSTFQMYPNPAKSNVNFRLQNGEKAEYTLIDATGAIVMKHEISSTNSQVDVSNLPTGNYTVQVKNGQSTTLKNLVVAK